MISESLFQFTFPQGLGYLLVAVVFLALPSSAGESLARILPSDWELLQHCLQRTGMQSFPNFALSKRSAVLGLTSPGTCSLTPCAMLGQDFFSAFLVPHSPDLGPVSNSIQACDLQLGFTLAILINFRCLQEFLVSPSQVILQGEVNVAAKCGQALSWIIYPTPTN